MVMNFVLLLCGLCLLLSGGHILVRGASDLAKSLGVSPLVIGLTAVAFGTSAPELSVNLLAAIKGQTEISFGNIIGSNIANIGLIIGISALIRPLALKGVIISREIPMLVLASLLAFVAGMDSFFRDSPNTFDRSDGLVFLLIFCVFLFYTIGDLIRIRKADPDIREFKNLPGRNFYRSRLFNFSLFIGGLILLLFGGKITVDSAVLIAELLKIPRAVIGLTIIAVGTSLPELVTSGIATWKGQTDIAIGNVVGSNLFNLLLVNGLCASFRPIAVPATGGIYDLSMMLILSLFLLPLGITDKGKIVRWEGIALLLMYSGYSLWRILIFY